MHKIILASQSPRRREILEKLEIPFEVIPSHVDEDLPLDCSGYEQAKTLSQKKAYAVVDGVKGPAVVIGVDTIVSDLGKVLTKPRNREDAVKMLRHLQGRHHSVFTGVTMLFVEEDGTIKEEQVVDSTEVTFTPLTMEEIEAYLGTDEYIDKAGGYGIQGKASLFVESVTGNYDTVVGFPVHLVYQTLKKHGIQLMDYWGVDAP